MAAGDVMIIIGTLAAFGAAFTRAQSLRSKNKSMVELSVMLSAVTFVAVTLALILLTYYFLTSDMSYYYVWSYSSTDLPSIYKLSGVWAGSQGSFLLWIWFMSLVLAVEVMLEPRRKYLTKKYHGVFQVVVSGIIFVFLLILMNMDLFTPTNHFLLQRYPGGDGLTLSLQTPEMIIHPPVVFAGYAFSVVAFAAAVAYFVTKDSNWHVVSLSWTRLAWIFLTLGIGIGAIWAYYVLGWGGYWAWDPVETSSLLPWLIATAFLHTQIRHSRKGEYGIVSPALGMLSFVAVVFATFATRAGGLWSASVHDFGSSVGDSAGARLAYLLEHDSTVLGIFSLMLALFAATVYLAFVKYRAVAVPSEQPEPEKWSGYISDKNNMLAAIVLLVVTGAIMLLLLFKNVSVTQSANYAEFNGKMSMFFVALMVAMTVCLLWKFVGKEKAFVLGVGLILISIAAAVGAAVGGYFDWLVGFSLPSYVVAIGASVIKLAKSGVAGSVRKTLLKASPHLIHLGVAMVLMSYVVSSSMQTNPIGQELFSGVAGNSVALGETVHVGDYEVKLVSLSAEIRPGTVGGGSEENVREATVDIFRSGHTLRQGVVLSDIYGQGSGGSMQVMDVEVYIYKAVLNDLYLNFQWVDNATALIQVKVVPFMNTLWIGFGLLVVGLAVSTVVWRQEPKETKPPEDQKQAPEKGKVAPSAKDQEYYESKVEEELRKFKQTKGK